MSSRAFAVFAFASIDFQRRWRKTRSRSMSSSDAPSAAVRTMMPPSFTCSFLRMSFSRERSSSSRRRETPRPSPCGTKTTKRPGSELRADDLVDVEEAVLLEADLDERGLHARKHVVDLAEVDVAGDRAAVGPLEVDLGDLVVLEHGDTLLADVDGDDQLALCGRERC